jgi:hypothetical protein
MANLPHETQAKVNVSANESVDSATINRSSTRLLANDLTLRDYICNVGDTTFTDGLTGNISLVSGGIVGISPDFLSNIDITDILSGLSLDDLSDVSLDDPTSGEALVFNEELGGTWINDVPDISFIVSGSFIEELQHVTGVELSGIGTLSGAPTSTTDVQTDYDFSFPISALIGDAILENEKIAGFWIYSQNWGRTNFDEGDQTGPGAVWETLVEFPDGVYRAINGYRALNSDDDGGVQSTQMVPFDFERQTELNVRLSLYNSNLSRVDDSGRPLNYFEIVALTQRSEAKDLTPDVLIEHIKGSVSNVDPIATISGQIDADTVIESPYYVWSSINPSVTYTNWEDIFPIRAPNNASKTEIEFTGFLAPSGTTSLDIGAEGSSTGIAKGNISIDWFKNTVNGTMMYYNGGFFTAQGGAVLSGRLSQFPLEFVDDGFGGLDIQSQIKVTFKRIKALPIVVSPSTGFITSNVAYVIRHYNTIGDDERGKLETFIGTTSGNVIEHGMSKTPDMFMCHIDGKDSNSFFSFSSSSVPNGTDGGLAYSFSVRHADITADDTNITIAGFTFPAGTRTFTGLVFPDDC